MPKTYNTFTDVSAGSVLTASDYNEVLENVGNYRVPPMCRCQASGAQAIASGGAAPTLVQWAGSDVFDTDSMHDPASNNTRITANTAGVYIVTGSVFLDNQTANRVQLEIARYTSGGSATPIETQEDSVSFGLNVTAIVNLAVNEYVTLGIYHTSGTNRTIGTRSYFSAAWIGQIS